LVVTVKPEFVFFMPVTQAQVLISQRGEASSLNLRQSSTLAACRAAG
jgi:hypothetical protein